MFFSPKNHTKYYKRFSGGTVLITIQDFILMSPNVSTPIQNITPKKYI